MGQGLALCKPAGEAYRVKHKKAARNDISRFRLPLSQPHQAAACSSCAWLNIASKLIGASNTGGKPARVTVEETTSRA